MYNIGDKFEIEIGGNFLDEFDNKLYRIKGFNSLVFDENGLNKLKKAVNESDIIKLQNDAFHDGYRKAQCEAFNQGYDAGYEDGYKSKTEHKNNVEKPIKTVKASELAVDTKVLCWFDGDEVKELRHFAIFFDEKLYAFSDGAMFKSKAKLICWDNMSLEDGTVVLPE